MQKHAHCKQFTRLVVLRNDPSITNRQVILFSTRCAMFYQYHNKQFFGYPPGAVTEHGAKIIRKVRTHKFPYPNYQQIFNKGPPHGPPDAKTKDRGRLTGELGLVRNTSPRTAGNRYRYCFTAARVRASPCAAPGPVSAAPYWIFLRGLTMFSGRRIFCSSSSLISLCSRTRS